MWVTYDDLKGKYPVTRQQLRGWARSGKLNYILLPSKHLKYQSEDIQAIFEKAEKDANARSRKD